jgi:hypothetical protein
MCQHIAKEIKRNNELCRARAKHTTTLCQQRKVEQVYTVNSEIIAMFLLLQKMQLM